MKAKKKKANQWMRKRVLVFGLLLVCLGGHLTLCRADAWITVGAVFAKSGEAAEDNLELLEAVRFAVNEVNANGGVHGKKIKLMEYDNHSTPIQSRLAAKKAVGDGVVAVIGASWSSHSLAMAPYLQKMKVPMISPDSTHPDVTRTGDYIFRACFVDSFQGHALARFARDKLKATTAVVVQNVTSNYSIGLSEIFQKHFTARGGNIAAVMNYKSQQTDFQDLLKPVARLDPDLLFVPGHAESGYIVRQAQIIGIRAKMLGGDGWPHRQFYANGGQDLKEGYYSAHWSKDLDTQKTKVFIRGYEHVYDVTDFAAISYDAAMLLFDAIKRAASISRSAIRDALATTKDFDGVTGKISMDKNGDPLKQVVIMKITDGRPALLMTIPPD
ncbi:ethanolamine utilization protein EutJ [Desulfosarcina ovata subsp. sediminis]|uniref:Ethanolamine utilization protein EutJ n=1 Tax=Desulfosarcina ovata subsp. sediminis TaxID=885957 RepID=A0A5K7ZR28_9BACT|nr:ABC transporter substrate-binding protein [Desulfosarcina ovata]BBO80463.1 ethanolamine utilization protein EutJ [Desulfosarcina ovata subsp. sediminis]